MKDLMQKETSLETEHISKTEHLLHSDTTTFFGFWLYLMTDLVLFASLFAVYGVLRTSTFGGPSGADIFNLPLVFTETLFLLTSSFTMGLTLMSARAHKKGVTLLCLALTGLLGLSFVSLEFSEFVRLVAAGHSWQQSGFLSAYFTLVGTHGLHVTLGLVWLIALALSIGVRGLTRSNMRKLLLFSVFWHFLDVVWIFIFTIVYLLGMR
jgi:cytochrome o ubiquinol oxidase subunit 3